jgi:hypothetical protein
MKYYFSLKLSATEFLPYYQGTFENVQVITNQGIKVEFPAMHLRKFITSSGIDGDFCLETKENKFLCLFKLK